MDRAVGAWEAQTPVVDSPGSTRSSQGGEGAMVSLLVQKLKTEAWQGRILGGDLQSVGAQRVERPGVVHRALSEHGVGRG